MRWFFTFGDGVVMLRARAEGAVGTIGDAIWPLNQGAEFYGLTFEQLADAGAGVIEIQRGKARIVEEVSRRSSAFG
jgi:hypothetical protein